MNFSDLEFGASYGYKWNNSEHVSRLVYIGPWFFLPGNRVREVNVDLLPAWVGRGLGKNGDVRVHRLGSLRGNQTHLFADVNKAGDRLVGLSCAERGNGFYPWSHFEEIAKRKTASYWRSMFEIGSVPVALVGKEVQLPHDKYERFSDLPYRSTTENLVINEQVQPTSFNHETGRVMVKCLESQEIKTVQPWQLVPYAYIETVRENDLREATQGWRQRAEDLLNAYAREHGEEGSPCSVGTKSVTLPHSVLEALLTAADGSESASAEMLDVISILRDERSAVASSGLPN